MALFKLSLVPRDKRFSILFQQGAQNVVKMANGFKEIIYTWEHVKERVSILTDMERDGDAITHEVIALLHRTFITPFDREDISLLAQSLDDIADRIHSSADIMLLYQIERPGDWAKELVDIILDATVEVEKAVSGISGHIDQNQLLKRCVEINRLENLGDRVYRSALADLYTESSDIFHVVKWREIYEDMESVIDGCEATANALEGIALKYA
jgi:predicted phosphate transport protein (TIGR00153 family)